MVAPLYVVSMQRVTRVTVVKYSVPVLCAIAAKLIRGYNLQPDKSSPHSSLAGEQHLAVGQEGGQMPIFFLLNRL